MKECVERDVSCLQRMCRYHAPRHTNTSFIVLVVNWGFPASSCLSDGWARCQWQNRNHHKSIHWYVDMRQGHMRNQMIKKLPQMMMSRSHVEQPWRYLPLSFCPYMQLHHKKSMQQHALVRTRWHLYPRVSRCRWFRFPLPPWLIILLLLRFTFRNGRRQRCYHGGRLLFWIRCICLWDM